MDDTSVVFIQGLHYCLFMTFRLIYAMAVLCLSGLLPVYASSFSGWVTDPGNEPLPGATVQLSLEGAVQATVTNQQGHFYFSDVNADEFQLTVSFVGYNTVTHTRATTDSSYYHIVLPPESRILQEVTVEDRFQQQRKREETVSVDVVGADYIKLHNSGSLMQTLRRLPGIQAVNVGSGQSKPLIRGLGFNRIIVAEHGIKHEGQQWGADHALEVDQFAHDYIELIKGPASLIYGSDAIGGVVQLSQRNAPPPGSLSGSVNLLGRSSNQLLGTSAHLEGRKQRWFFSSRITWLDYADARVPVDSVDVYSYRVPLHKNRLRNTAGNEQNFHFSLGYTSRQVTSRLFFSHVQQKAGFFANAHGLEPRRVNTELYDRSDRDILYPRQQATHLKLINRTMAEWGNTRLISETGYQRNHREEFSQYVNHGYKPPVFPDSLNFPSYLERGFDKHTLSANVRIRQHLSEQHQLTLGTTAEHQDNSIEGVSFLMPAFRQWLTGMYLLHEWQAGASLRVSSGVRYDHAFLHTESYHDWFPTLGSYLQRAEALDREMGSFSGMLGVNYHRGATIVRANVGRSFRVPLAKELAANGVNYHHFSYEVGDATLNPETAWQLDMGVEHTASWWSVHFSPFVTWFPNYIYLNPSHLFDFDYGAGNQIFHYTASEVLRWGGEVALQGNLTENLFAELSAEYTYSEQLSGDKKGFTLPFSPPGSLLAGISWSPWRSISAGDLRDLTVMADARFTSAQNRIVPPERKTPGYQTYHLGVKGTLTLNRSSLNWNIMVNNLFNTHYLEHTSYYRLIGVPEPGRNITISLQLPVDIIAAP
ncbi:MAG: TonB-dependent receptor [Bacteroidetes bacterium]|nr:MAG: TonB-dependent receptor [Bacteroidota bacterium]